MLSVLRINRSFMQYMRKHHAQEARQQFIMTVVEEESAAPAASTIRRAACRPPHPPLRPQGQGVAVGLATARVQSGRFTGTELYSC